MRLAEIFVMVKADKLLFHVKFQHHAEHCQGIWELFPGDGFDTVEPVSIISKV
jgi:hypothetical protein